MKKIEAFIEEFIPKLWGTLLVIIVTVGSFGLAVKVIKWVVDLLKVVL